VDHEGLKARGLVRRAAESNPFALPAMRRAAFPSPLADHRPGFNVITIEDYK
jgi:hypothetical protein